MGRPASVIPRVVVEDCEIIKVSNLLRCGLQNEVAKEIFDRVPLSLASSLVLRPHSYPLRRFDRLRTIGPIQSVYVEQAAYSKLNQALREGQWVTTRPTT
jgi:hypothetical protein